MGAIQGVRSFEEMRKRSKAVQFGDCELLVGALAGIIKSKNAAGRPRDRAVLEILERTLEETSHDEG